MGSFWTTWHQEARSHRSVLVLTLVGLLGLALAPMLVAAGMGLVAQLVAGLAVAPLALVLYLCLLPTGPWPEDDGGPGRDEGDPDRPGPSSEPDASGGWERFEREFWAYLDERSRVA
jgi:hypothetical protein